jgi:hypothetical protein
MDKYDIVAENYSNDYQGLAKEIYKAGLRRGYEKAVRTAVPEYSLPDDAMLCNKCACAVFREYDYCPSCGAKLLWETKSM